MDTGGWLADVVLAGVIVASVIVLQEEASAVIEELMAFCDKAANANPSPTSTKLPAFRNGGNEGQHRCGAGTSAPWRQQGDCASRSAPAGSAGHRRYL
jgi:hypothetical protein